MKGALRSMLARAWWGFAVTNVVVVVVLVGISAVGTTDSQVFEFTYQLRVHQQRSTTTRAP